MTSYPTWVYHRTEKARIVKSAEEFAALPDKDNWADTPAAFYQPEPESAPTKRGKAK